MKSDEPLRNRQGKKVRVDAPVPCAHARAERTERGSPERSDSSVRWNDAAVVALRTRSLIHHPHTMARGLVCLWSRRETGLGGGCMERRCDGARRAVEMAARQGSGGGENEEGGGACTILTV